MNQLRDRVAEGRIVVLTTGSHYVFLTNETEVVQLIRGFPLEQETKRSGGCCSGKNLLVS
jgi:hypothetical protein